MIFNRRIYTPILAGFLGLSLLLYLLKAPQLPTAAEPLIFYSTNSKDDLRLLYVEALSQAKGSLFVKSYGLTDPEMLALLSKKAEQGCKTTVIYDRDGSGSAPAALSPLVTAVAVKGKGLMHQKICLINSNLCLLGSANFTPSSLRMHDNIVIGIHSEEICTFLREQKKNYIEVLERVECYILPNDKALRAICKAIDSAKKEICIAIFTFTHQEIVENLKAAHNRGVRVTVAIEKTTAFGASKKIVDDLEKSGITVKISEGLQLLHHKWIWIDETTLIVGSANLTRSAFEKNCDCVLLIHSLTKKEQNVIKKIWRKLLSHPLIGTIYL